MLKTSCGAGLPPIPVGVMLSWFEPVRATAGFPRVDPFAVE
ncbi:MAG: hypothetical protein V9H25_00300 [Candidatus Competibacter sp.]|jgi:hypothetical protein